MRFTALIPARLASTRLPNKPLADIAGLPMVVRVAQRAALSGAARVVVAADHVSIVDACRMHGVEALLTRVDHASGSDRLAEACVALGLDGSDLVVNVQGDEPLIDPALVERMAIVLGARGDCVMSTAAHAIADDADWRNPNVVKVVLDAAGRALYFSRASIPHWRDAVPPASLQRSPRRCATSACMATGRPSCAPSPRSIRRRWNGPKRWSSCGVLWHGERIAVHVTDTAPGIGVGHP